MEKALVKLLKPLTEYRFSRGAKRMKKFVKKNEKNPIDEKHPYEKRYKYTLKKFNKYLKGNGIEVKHKGKDYLPRGSFMLVANYTTPIDFATIMIAMGEERKAVVLQNKEDQKRKRLAGYLWGINGFYSEDRSNPEDKVTNAATSWSKSNNRSIIMFPEFTPSDNVEEFSVVPFEMAKKFFIPIVPVTIKGSKEAMENGGKITVIFHDVIKPMQLATQKPQRVSQMVSQRIRKTYND